MSRVTLPLAAAGRRHAVLRRPFFVLLALVVLPVWGAGAAAQQPGVTLSGRVSDVDGAPLLDVAITAIPGLAGAPTRTVLTDRLGFYRLDGLPAGDLTLRVRRLGFAAVEMELTLASGEERRLDLELSVETLRLEGVIAEGRRAAERERARFETDAGVTARVVEGSTLKVLPGLAEADVLRAIELMPGVLSTSDFSSAFHVRGGSADQNLILIDGFTVFNPFHLGGLFSVFNSDAIERAELFAGGFGAEYGGRVSSVLNVESRSEIPDGMEVTGGISILASRLLLRAPLPRVILDRTGGSGSWFVSARRSYFDQLLRPVTDFPYHLTDLQGYANLELADGGRISFTAYRGKDVLDLANFGTEGGEPASVLRLRWGWGNRVLGARWLQPLAGGWMLDSRLGLSRFSEALGFTDFGDMRLTSSIEQLSWRSDLATDLTTDLSLRTGAAAERMSFGNLARAGGTTFLSSAGDGVLASGYATLGWRPGEWIIEPGLRIDSWHGADAARLVSSPRFAVKRFLGQDRSVGLKLAVGRYSQFLHSLRDEELPISNDTWVLAGRNVPPIVSNQIQVGFETFWREGWSGSIEAYARDFSGVTEFNFADDPNTPGDDLLVGDGHSYGADFLLRRSIGHLTGWAALSLLRAQRTMPDPLSAGWDDLPPVASHPPVFDRRANLDLVANYATEGGLEVGARWNYGTGLPYTRPLAQHFGWRQNPIWGRYEPVAQGIERDGVPVYAVLGPRNAERYPAYHRLDVTVRRTFEPGWGTVVPYLQILNVYNHRNVLFYFYDYNRTPPIRSGFSMFPFLPAIGVEVSF